jgi:hypothetical protein
MEGLTMPSEIAMATMVLGRQIDITTQTSNLKLIQEAAATPQVTPQPELSIGEDSQSNGSVDVRG